MDADSVRSAKGQTMASILFFRDFPAHSRKITKFFYNIAELFESWTLVRTIVTNSIDCNCNVIG